MRRTAGLAAVLCLWAAACGQADPVPVLSGVPAVSRPASSEKESEMPSRTESAEPPGASSRGVSSRPRSGGSSSESRLVPVSRPPSPSSVGQPSPSSAASGGAPSAPAASEPRDDARAPVADSALRRYLNAECFGRTGDRAPTLAEMAGLERIRITENVGIRSLRGLESAVNLRYLEIRQNPVETLADVDWTRLNRLEHLLLFGSETENLQNVRLGPSLLSLAVAGLGPEDRGRLSALDGADWTAATSLRTLNFSYNRLADFSPLLVDFPFLQSLSLEGNPVPSEEAARFRRQFLVRNPGARVAIFPE